MLDPTDLTSLTLMGDDNEAKVDWMWKHWWLERSDWTEHTNDLCKSDWFPSLRVAAI